MPLLSIVLPTFNRCDLLVAAIESILAQDSPDFELIISDNCSTDRTQEAVSAYLDDSRVKYFRNDSNLGMVGNWKKVIFERAQAEWFLIMSDDDLLIDNAYISKALTLIRRNPSIKFVYAGGYVLDEETGTKKLLEPPFSGVTDGKAVFLSRGTVSPQDIMLCNMIFRRDDAIQLKFLRNENNLSCDSELYLKLCLLGDVGVVQEPVSIYRFHQGNLVKKTLTSAKYIAGNLDYLVEPYVLATKVLDTRETALFRQRVQLDQFLKSSLLRLASHKRADYLAAKAWLRTRVPEIIDHSYRDPVFIAKLLLVRCFRPLVNKRVGITE